MLEKNSRNLSPGRTKHNKNKKRMTRFQDNKIKMKGCPLEP